MSEKKGYDGSHLEMNLWLEGKKDLILKIQTYWDESEKQWIAAIKTPKTLRLIHAVGKDSLELQNNFNAAMKEMMMGSDELGEEIFGMFKERQNEGNG